MKYLVGTLSRSGGQGIICCTLKSNDIQHEFTYRPAIDSTWLTKSKDGKHIFSTGTSAVSLNGFTGQITEFALQGNSLVPGMTYSTGGDGPCHMALSSDEHFLFAANYRSGSLAVFPLAPNLSPASQIVSFCGSGPNRERQEKSHIHQVTRIPNSNLLAVVDLGSDALYTFIVDAQSSTLYHMSQTHVFGGPRHLAFLSDDKACLVHELSNEISILERKNDSFQILQTLSTLPSPYAQSNLAAAIRISSDRKYIFVSNRGMGSIAVFRLQSNGLLSPEGHIPAGSYPRDFLLLSEERFLVADQSFGLRLIDQRGNQLTSLICPGAVCILPC